METNKNLTTEEIVSMDDIIEMVEGDPTKKVFTVAVETLSPLAEHSTTSDILTHIVKHIVKNDALVCVTSANCDYIVTVLYSTQLELSQIITPANYKISEHCSGYMCTIDGGINVSHDYFIPYAIEEDSVTAEFSASAYENGEPPLIIK